MRVLVAFASKHGSTREVAEALARELRDLGHDVDCESAASVRTLDGYDGVVLGGAIYFGRWHKDAVHFCKLHRSALATRPWSVFGMGPQTLEQQAVASSRAELDAALAEVPGAVPDLMAIFGGVVDPARLRFPFSHMPACDARDWDAIRAWAAETSALFEQYSQSDERVLAAPLAREA
jgi:menaquinone-dependent protoporphyrinogen oxidase